MRVFVRSLCLLALAACASPSPEQILRDQQDAWNRGAVEGFFELGYWNSPYLTFYSADQRHVGYQAVLQRYLERYGPAAADPDSGEWDPRATMGELRFSELDTTYLGGEHVLLRGRWELNFPDQERLHGLFTLIMIQVDGEWRIMHDHTSSAPAEQSSEDAS